MSSSSSSSCCTCCNKPGKDPRCCVCMPYGDPYLATAQILSVVSFLMSWVWWVTLVLAMPVVSTLSVVWCFKMRKPGLLVAAAFAVAASIGSLFTGLWMIFKWKDDEWCSIFTLTWSDDYTYYYDDENPGAYFYNETSGNVTFFKYEGPPVEQTTPDYCREVAWAFVAFVNCLLFAVIAFCTVHFVTARMHKFLNKAAAGEGEQTNDAYHVEMGSLPPGATTTTVGATASAVPVDPVGTTTSSAGDTTAATPTMTVAAITATASALPPEVLAKMEDQDF